MTAEQFRSHFSKYSFPKLGYIKIPKIKIPEEDYPTLSLAANADSKDYLLALVKRGFAEKLENGKIPTDKKDIYWKQAEFELGEINKLLFTDYILLVYHVIRFCRKNNILNSPGRGSCVGSLLLYLLQVTTVDPVKHGLLFERFISAARTDSKEFDGETYISSESLPDVDLDSDCALKHKVNEFIENLFPSRNCAIANYNTLQGKVAIKETCKIFLGYSEDEALGVSDLIDKKFGNVDSITVSLEENEYFQNWVNKSPKNKEAALIAAKLQGLIKNFSVHASGIILTENPVEDTIPVKLGSDKQIVTAVDMSVAQLFGIKLDNLGLKNLTTINDAFVLLGKNPMEMHDIDVNDPSIYQFVNDKEQFFGIFQAQDGLGKQILKSFQPKSIDDISLSIAVGRPGAMKFAKDIVKARQEGESEEFHQMPEEVKAVLKESGGYCLEENSLVYCLNKGKYVKIKDVDIGDKVQSLDEENNSCVDTVVDKINNGIKTVYEIKLFNGASIQATEDHRFLTEFGWKPLRELKTGKSYLATPKKLIRDNCADFDENKLQILGLLISEGGFTSQSSINFFNKDISLLNHFKKLMNLAFPDVELKERIQVRDVVRLTAINKNPKYYHEPSSLLLWLRELGLKTKSCYDGGCNSSQKFVPEFIFGLRDELIGKFLASMWEGDGCITERDVRYKTISKQLIYDIQSLLLLLGIKCHVLKTKWKKVVAYDLVCAENKKFIDKIARYLVVKKIDKLVDREAKYVNTFDKGLIKEEFELKYHPISPKSFYKKYKIKVQPFRDQSVKSCSRLNVFTANALNERFELSELSKRSKLNFHNKIVSIRKIGERKVYDLTIENNHNFVANNIIVHNCSYQEQIMKLCKIMAKFTDSETNLVRKYVAKKNKAKLSEYKSKFIDGSIKHGYKKELAEKLWESFEASGDYAFNKSHSTGYAYLTAITCYLKANHSLEYFVSLLRHVEDDAKGTKIEKIGLIQSELHHFGIKLLPPHIILSDLDFKIEGPNIRFGLGDIKGIAAKSMQKLLSFRDSKHSSKFEIFESAEKAKLNIGILSSLIQAGTLDDDLAKHKQSRSRLVLEAQVWRLLTTREKRFTLHYAPNYNNDLLSVILAFKEEKLKDDKGKEVLKDSRFETIKRDYERYKKIYLQNKSAEEFACWYYERKLLGFPYSSNLRGIFSKKNSGITGVADVVKAKQESKHLFVGIVDEVKSGISKARGTRWFRMTVKDEYESFNVLLFNDKIDNCKEVNGDLPKEEDVVIIEGTRKSDAVFADFVKIQEHKVYTKLSDLKETENAETEDKKADKKAKS